MADFTITFDDVNRTANITATPTPEPTTAVIVAALQRTRVMVEQGWCRGRCRDGHKVCLIGALAESTTTAAVAIDGLPGYKVYRDTKNALEAQLPFNYPNLIAFNDFTNQQKVLELIDFAITAQGESK